MQTHLASLELPAVHLLNGSKASSEAGIVHLPGVLLWTARNTLLRQCNLQGEFKPCLLCNTDGFCSAVFIDTSICRLLLC